MRRSFSAAIACLAFFGSTFAWGEYKPVDLETVPVDRLIENLSKAVEANPKDSVARLNLARAHGMAYALKADTAETLKKAPERGAWFGFEPSHVPFSNKVTATTDAKRLEAAKRHLEQAIARYEETIKLDAKYLSARLGLAWCLDQAGRKDEALAKYREVVEMGWEAEKELTKTHRGWHSVTAEAAGYLIPLLDPRKDEKELTELNARIAKARTVKRPVTPLAIPLADGRKVEQLLDADARVRFDVDGSSQGKEWTWITPEAGWLVHDPKGRGEISSGLQLFGNVTFWMLWDNGYQALASLDNDRDGRLSGKELAGLAIWRDANSNGKSESGEVRPLADYGIVALSCRSQSDRERGETVAAWSPDGVQFRDGSTRPTYDVLLRPARSSP